MKRIVFCVLMALIFIYTSISVFADDKPTVGVLRFTNKTGAAWWRGTTGQELQEMLIAELVSTKAFHVLERKEIEKVISEQKISESGLVDDATRVKIGNLKVAKYLIAGTVSSYEEHTGGTGGGIGIMGFRIGAKKDSAYIAVDLKVISTETAAIVDARTIEASSESSGLSLGAAFRFFTGELSNYEKTPTGKAIRACIIEITDYLKCSLIKGQNDSCMQEYIEKEATRRERTKKSIKLQ
ncbi:MAG: CsgG/HfaB family protein [Syntrophorhabdaceae bacterium]|nr:CsgG/HfaB family protein [Syntrophorhabdaceae bacterium]